MAKDSGLNALLKEMRSENDHNKQVGFFVRLATPNNRTLFMTLPKEWEDFNPQRIPADFAKDNQWFTQKAEDDDDQLEITGRRLANESIIQVGLHTDVRLDFLERFQHIFILFIIPVIILGFAGGSFLANRTLRPILDLIRTVKAVDTGDMDARVPLRDTSEELRELTQLFNNMLTKIKNLITGMREALDNVAHDLRIPMTRIRGTLESSLQSEDDTGTLREALMDCAEESERMATMLNNLMDISEAETGVMNLHLEKVSISDLIMEVVELYQYVAQEKVIEITTSIPENLIAVIDKNRIRQAFANVLDNAVKYSLPKGDPINIKVDKENSEIMISTHDSGIGIAEHELSRIFERLYRGDKSRSQWGMGLGLSLVKAVAKAHGGRINVESKQNQGTVITIIIPDKLKENKANQKIKTINS